MDIPNLIGLDGAPTAKKPGLTGVHSLVKFALEHRDSV